MRLGNLGWVVGGGGVGILIASLGWGLVHPAASPPTGLSGRPAPATSIAALDGSSVSLATYHGTPLVVNFWASWCVPCRQEAPLLNAAAQRYSGHVQFIGVDIQDSDSAARAYQAEIKSPYPVGPSGQGSYLRWGVAAPPETFFIDRQGIVVSRIIGPVDARGLELHVNQLGP